jgi:hypothetical protein
MKCGKRYGILEYLTDIECLPEIWNSFETRRRIPYLQGSDRYGVPARDMEFLHPIPIEIWNSCTLIPSFFRYKSDASYPKHHP